MEIKKPVEITEITEFFGSPLIMEAPESMKLITTRNWRANSKTKAAQAS